MTVENQTYYSDYNQCQNYMSKNLAAATAIVKIGDHIPGPCKHREEHEHKVKDCQIIYEGKKGLDFLVLVQKPPCHVYDNVAAGSEMEKKASSLTAHFHLPGLFEFYDFYRVFLPLYRKHRDFFYDWCEIDSIYGSPQDCLWGGGRTSDGRADAKKVLSLVDEFGISPRLTFSNSLIREEHFCDKKCNSLCEIFKNAKAGAGIIIHSDLLLEYLKSPTTSAILKKGRAATVSQRR